MTILEFDNKLTLLRQGADKTKNIRDRLVFLLKAIEFVEELADDVLDLPKASLPSVSTGSLAG